MSSEVNRMRNNLQGNVAHCNDLLSDIDNNISELKSRISSRKEAQDTRGVNRRRVNYAAMHNGSNQDFNSDQEENIADLEGNLRDRSRERIALVLDLINTEEELETFNSSVGPITTLDFQAYTVEKVQPAYN